MVVFPPVAGFYPGIERRIDILLVSCVGIGEIKLNLRPVDADASGQTVAGYPVKSFQPFVIRVQDV